MSSDIHVAIDCEPFSEESRVVRQFPFCSSLWSSTNRLEGFKDVANGFQVLQILKFEIASSMFWQFWNFWNFFDFLLVSLLVFSLSSSRFFLTFFNFSSNFRWLSPHTLACLLKEEANIEPCEMTPWDRKTISTKFTFWSEQCVTKRLCGQWHCQAPIDRAGKMSKPTETSSHSFTQQTANCLVWPSKPENCLLKLIKFQLNLADAWISPFISQQERCSNFRAFLLPHFEAPISRNEIRGFHLRSPFKVRLWGTHSRFALKAHIRRMHTAVIKWEDSED